MNPSDSDRPSLLCRLVRLWAAFRSEDSTAGHIARCTSCQQYFDSAGQFESQLRREARAEMQRPPDGLDLLIMQGVRRSAAPERRQRARLPFVFSVLGATAALTGAVFFIGHLVNPPADDPSAEIEALAAFARTLPGRVLDPVANSAVQLAQRDPLREQLDSVVSDARSALDFLAVNFLPSDGSSFPASHRVVLPAQET